MGTMNTTKEELLERLHRITAEELIERIQSGDASAAEIGCAIKFLKDNGMDVSTEAVTPIRDLSNIVPFAMSRAQAE